MAKAKEKSSKKNERIWQAWQFDWREGWTALEDFAILEYFGESDDTGELFAERRRSLGYTCIIESSLDTVTAYSAREDLSSELAKKYPYIVTYMADQTCTDDIFCADFPSFIELMTKLGIGQRFLETADDVEEILAAAGQMVVATRNSKGWPS